jgi:2-methylisocitrate lyase-like PEP mutase family enzyme
LEHRDEHDRQPTTASVVGTAGSGSPANVAARRQAFRTLHDAGCFVVPNPWDVGSARYLQHLGFTALATTSAGFAFSQGLPDCEVALSRDRNLGYIADMVAAADVPVTADFASGYGRTPQDVADGMA